MRTQFRSLASLSGSGIAVSYGVGCRCGLDLTSLWLWCRPGATSPIPLAWEPPYASGAALKKTKKKKEKKKKSQGCFIQEAGNPGEMVDRCPKINSSLLDHEQF